MLGWRSWFSYRHIEASWAGLPNVALVTCLPAPRRSPTDSESTSSSCRVRRLDSSGKPAELAGVAQPVAGGPDEHGLGRPAAVGRVRSDPARERATANAANHRGIASALRMGRRGRDHFAAAIRAAR